MHIAVFGATSKVGRATVVKLIEQNHTVTVFEDGENPFINHPSIKIVQGNLRNTAEIARTLENADAVICAAGGWQTSVPFAPAMRDILTEMERLGVWRIITLVNAVAHIDGDNTRSVSKWVYKFFKILAPKALRDYEDQIRFLQSSKADWTVIRAPEIRKKGKKGTWKFSLDPPSFWERVHAEDAADAIVKQLSDDHYVNQAPFLKGR